MDHVRTHGANQDNPIDEDEPFLESRDQVEACVHRGMDHARMDRLTPADLERGYLERHIDGEVRQARVRYRVGRGRFNLGGIIGHMRESDLVIAVRAALRGKLKAIGDEQRNGDWKLAAYRLTWGTMARNNATPGDGRKSGDLYDGREATAVRRYAMRRETVLIVDMVFVDELCLPEIDPAYARNPNVRGELWAYEHQGAPLPRRLQAQYDIALEVLKGQTPAPPQEPKEASTTDDWKLPGRLAVAQGMLDKGSSMEELALLLGAPDAAALADALAQLVEEDLEGGKKRGRRARA